MAVEWARLLQRQQDDGKLGLTPSFLIGALRGLPGSILGAQSGRPELRALLQMMRDEQAPNGRVASIFECQNILQPVATLSSSEAPGDPIRSAPGAKPRLYVWPWFPSKRPVDFDWLLDALWAKFGDAISTGNFSYSRQSRQFHPFDRNDDDFIVRAFRDPDDHL